jgi:F-type H+-transporting ATPase subunit b
MINLSILISSSKVSGPGGLFDIDATLPLVAIQFLLIMGILNIILYNPLLTIMEERKEYVLTNLSQASNTLAEANTETRRYEEQLEGIREEAQFEITSSQQIYKAILKVEVDTSQLYIDNLLYSIEDDLLLKKNITLDNLKEVVPLLCDSIETHLAI